MTDRTLLFTHPQMDYFEELRGRARNLAQRAGIPLVDAIYFIVSVTVGHLTGDLAEAKAFVCDDDLALHLLGCILGKNQTEADAIDQRVNHMTSRQNDSLGNRRRRNRAAVHLNEIEMIILAVISRFESLGVQSYEKAVEAFTRVIYTIRHGAAEPEDEENAGHMANGQGPGVAA